MEAKIITAKFGMTAQNRDSGYVRTIKDKSSLVAEMAHHHANIKSRHGWRSGTTGKPHRFIIFSNTEKYGLEPVARCSIETTQELINGIIESDDEAFLAVLRLDEPFDAQWPKDRGQDTLEDIIANPIDTRFKDEAEVVLAFPAAAETP